MITELEAVNYILAQVGAAPVTNLTSLQPDVQNAILRLKEARTWLQKRGWWFNTELNVTLPPDVNTNKIALPANTMKILKAWPKFVIPRNGFAYSPYDNSDQFDGALYVDVVINLDWDTLPPTAQDVVRIRAAKDMILIELEDRNKAQLLEDDYNEAMRELKKDDLEVRKRSIYSGPTILRRRAGVRPGNGRGGRAINPSIPGG